MISHVEFIIGLMRTETDSLGFIPSTAIKDRFVKGGHYRMIRGRGGRRIGYLIIGPMHPDKPLHIHQACVDYDHRRRHWAATAVKALIMQAHQARVQEIRLRCAVDLEANAFWLAMGFRLTGVRDGGGRRNRLIASYALQID